MSIQTGCPEKVVLLPDDHAVYRPRVNIRKGNILNSLWKQSAETRLDLMLEALARGLSTPNR